MQNNSMENAYQNHSQALNTPVDTAQTKTGLAATGGILAGIGASACCLLPFLLTMMGFTGVWMANLRAMTAYKPYFITFSVIVLAYGFYQVYWKVPKTCAEGAACTPVLPGRLVKGGLWSGAVIVILAGSFNYWFPMVMPYLP